MSKPQEIADAAERRRFYNASEFRSSPLLVLADCETLADAYLALDIDGLGNPPESVSELRWQRDVLQSKYDAAIDALQHLYDEQNGPPLLGPKQKYWDEAIIKTRHVLGLDEVDATNEEWL